MSRKPRDYTGDWAKRDLRKCMVKEARKRHKHTGIPVTITYEDIIIPNYCPILGIKLERGSGGSSDSSPSLDRIIPERGYVPGNVVVISNRANKIKNDATAFELMKIAEWLSKNTY